MRQQINLYQDILIEKPEPLQSRLAFILLLLTIFFLALYSGFSYWQVQDLTARVDQARQQYQAESQRISELEAQYPEPRKNVLLVEKIKRLEQEIQSQNAALHYFSEQDPEGNGKILASLNGLAQNSLRGVWLRRVRMLARGAEVQLAGSAVEAERIPDYLSLIGEQNIFAGKVFARLKVNRVEKQFNQVDFLLESTVEGGN